VADSFWRRATRAGLLLDIEFVDKVLVHTKQMICRGKEFSFGECEWVLIFFWGNQKPSALGIFLMD
jgi:hypothetical protein